MSANPFARGSSPSWATAWGEDRYGVWAAFTVENVTHRMRWIPPGRFMMGSPEGEEGRRHDETLHEVVLTRGHWLGETPVTQGLWEAVMGANPNFFKGADRPVEQVSWKDCAAFMRELNKRVRGLGVWFPTEAEWERACRGGTATATWEGDLKYVDDAMSRAPQLEEIAWYWGNSHNETHPVSRKRANPFGLYDMLGNVWEWCADWYGAYPQEAVDPTGLESGTGRVLRGASWVNDASSVRAAQRYAYDPRIRDRYVGLRLARGQAALKEEEDQAKRVKGTPGGRRGGADARRRGAEGSRDGG